MKKFIKIFLSFIVLISTTNTVAYAKIQLLETNDEIKQVSDIIKIQHATYIQTKRFILNIGDIISRDVLNLLNSGSARKDLFLSQPVGLFVSSQKVSIASQFFVCSQSGAKTRVHEVARQMLLIIFFVFIAFLIRYLGLLRLFYSNTINKLYILQKTHKFNLCVFLFERQQYEL